MHLMLAGITGAGNPDQVRRVTFYKAGTPGNDNWSVHTVIPIMAATSTYLKHDPAKTLRRIGHAIIKTGACFLLALVLTACVTTPVKNSRSQANKHLKAAAISAAAYNQNPKTRLSLLSEQQLSEVTYIGLRETSADNLTTEYLVAEKDGTLFISFTGSNAKNDWLRNLNAQYKPYQNMPYPIHKGFVLSWEEVHTDIMALIREKKPSSIALSGHSKGGAVASVAALKLLTEGVAVSEVTTFGALRSLKFHATNQTQISMPSSPASQR